MNAAFTMYWQGAGESAFRFPAGAALPYLTLSDVCFLHLTTLFLFGRLLVLWFSRGDDVRTVPGARGGCGTFPGSGANLPASYHIPTLVLPLINHTRPHLASSRVSSRRSVPRLQPT